VARSLPGLWSREWHVHEPAFYYDCLAPHSARLDLWETEYMQVMAGAEAILDWYMGTGLRPYFAALSNSSDRERFAAAYLQTIRAEYPARPDGRVLFPFRRLFLIAYTTAIDTGRERNATRNGP
jgi:trans-aconitate 2-methyltransferase